MYFRFAFRKTAVVWLAASIESIRNIDLITRNFVVPLDYCQEVFFSVALTSVIVQKLKNFDGKKKKEKDGFDFTMQKLYNYQYFSLFHLCIHINYT